MVNALAKMKEFDSAWTLVLDRIDRDDGEDEKLVSVGTFAIMIRRYVRAGSRNFFFSGLGFQFSIFLLLCVFELGFRVCIL